MKLFLKEQPQAIRDLFDVPAYIEFHNNGATIEDKVKTFEE